ncbi:MAG: hypothetical protein OIN88_15905 [Candidatus Methanoperedens sp.]|nr:hypothetical protein [Candidatus Methanoperedens sp.]
MPNSNKASSGLNRSTQNNGYLSRFVRFLTYKAELAGKKVIDRDKNSAINIMLRFLSQNAMWTGYQQFADNLRNTGLTISILEVHSREAPCVSVG